jgi:hypothetical protein
MNSRRLIDDPLKRIYSLTPNSIAGNGVWTRILRLRHLRSWPISSVGHWHPPGTEAIGDNCRQQRPCTTVEDDPELLWLWNIKLSYISTFKKPGLFTSWRVSPMSRSHLSHTAASSRRSHKRCRHVWSKTMNQRVPLTVP